MPPTPTPPCACQPPDAVVFRAGTEGYHTFRIPSLITTPAGVVLAFCEGRKNASSDTGDIDLVLRRSLDGGEAWGPLQIIWDDGLNTCGNPCPVVDRDTGSLWLLLTHNLGQDRESQILDGTSEGARTVWVTHSTDDGATWAPPEEITATTKQPDWTWYATGPGVGIQLRSGRMVIPCDNAVAGTKMGQSHVIISDDHGATWKLGGVVGEQVNESQVAELADGTLLINMRNWRNSGSNQRAFATSTDGGMTWSAIRRDPALIEPVCQASLIACRENGDWQPVSRRLRNRCLSPFSGPTDPQPRLLLFSNPASVTRDHMTVRLSEDGGKTWRHSRLLYEGPAAYSCLTVLPNGRIGCLYERGEDNPYESIVVARFGLEWLREGQT